MTNEFKGNEIDAINSSSAIYDALDPIIKKKVKEPRTFQKIQLLTRDFMSKNEYALLTNIIGRRIIVNEKFENTIYDIFDMDKAEIKKIILNSPYFKETFGRELSLTDQLCLAFPLLLASLEYKLLNRKEESELCYLLIHFKPYSSRESVFFKFGVKEGQMLYTVEKSLSERYDIKKYGTIIGALQKRAASSYENYIAPLTLKDVYTDKKLYITYTSGIASSVNTFIGSIVEEYRKNEGKSLDFDASAVGVLDKDADEMEYEDADIASDVAIKNNIVNKALLKITKNPVDKKIALLACQSGFNGSSSNLNILMTTLDAIIDKMFKQLNPFFTALISSFLFHDKPGGGKYTMNDFKSPVFLNVGIDILAGKKQNIKDVNMIQCRKIMNDMCENYCDKFALDGWGETTKRCFKQALAAYWVFLIKSAN